MQGSFSQIKIINASENNLKGVSLNLPKNRFIVVTGVSGSGKSSLAFDVIHGEGRRKYLENLNLQARQLLGKLQKPDVDEIINLTATLALSQSNFGNNPRSTVGTLTEIYDHLRILFARLGKSNDPQLKISRSLFSFNSPLGACDRCNGLGLEDRIDPNLLIDDPNKSIRERCFKITNPKGYIIYSQVTIDALNEVCEANGFNVDIPWKDLTEEQKNVVLNGSDKIKIPYGKHTLESRMRWSGITAKPREEGYYKGILPVMDQILQRDRNPNILRFSKTQTCRKCQGKRLNEASLSVRLGGINISEFAEFSLQQLKTMLEKLKFGETEKQVAVPILAQINSRIEMLSKLGLGYLACNRRSSTLSGGELQRIQLSKLVTSQLRNITFIFDEPSVGVHPANHHELISTIRQLVKNGNTAIVVEHDADTILHADWIVEVGPGAGVNGGAILFNGTKESFLKSEHPSLTRDYLLEKEKIKLKFNPGKTPEAFKIKDAEINNLNMISAEFLKNRLNVVTGVSGSGKSSLVKQTLLPLLQNSYFDQINAKGNPQLENADFRQVIAVDRSPIGKNARSTPATYTKVFDLIRGFYTSLDLAKKQKLNAGSFSFNTGKGRCETCDGAGKLEVGMHFLGNVESICPTCNGLRYHEEMLAIMHESKNIADVLNMSVKQALDFFGDQPKIAKALEVMKSIGLGYMKLGQSSGTLSGGEAQRVKLATEIIKGSSGNKLFIFDEPTTGLHFFDIQILLDLFAKLLAEGNTIIAIEHHPDFIKNAHHIIDLGPGSAESGGNIVFNGSVEDFYNCKNSITSKFLNQKQAVHTQVLEIEDHKAIEFTGVSTNNLRIPSVKFPYGKHIVITGKSGSGKSSLAFDTLFAEAQNRFVESFPAYVRRFMGKLSQTKFESVSGLTPTLALKQNQRVNDPRSTLGTLTEIFVHYRLLFSRYGKANGKLTNLKASDFSFNNSEGSCPTCSGLGYILTSSPDLLIEDKKMPIEKGAFGNHKSWQFYTDPYGQYMAMLHTIGNRKGIDFSKPVEELSADAMQLALFGTGEESYDVNWQFNRKGRTGSHQYTGTWKGFVNLLLEEYYRKHANGKGEDLRVFLMEDTCTTCKGQRFKDHILQVRFCEHNIHSITQQSIRRSIELFQEIKDKPADFGLANDFGIKQSQILNDILQKLQNLANLGLDYINLNRQSKTLSGGELQRVFLSTHLTGGLTGMTYVLDEPSTGLHPWDAEKVNQSIRKIVEQGNTVMTVEHNPEVIRQADHIIETGPGAGKAGGQIIFEGTVEEVLEKEILTSKSLKLKAVIDPIKIADLHDFIRIQGANANNLKSIDVQFKTGCLNVVTGVSGSGKTSLLRDVLFPSYKSQRAIHCKKTEGFDRLNFVQWIEKTAGAGSASSTPATYTGIFDEIRKIFALTPGAKLAKLKAADFSFNSKAGQCPDCKGLGYKQVPLDFLADVKTECETCNGKRYQPFVLDIHFQEKTISEVLEMSIEEASIFFSKNKSLSNSLSLVQSLGLGHIQLGRQTGSLSGGELQRLQMAREILSQKPENGLFIFDEPSRGLHLTDLTYLINLAEYLIGHNNTVIFIEHNPHIICRANHVIDLGPGSGEFGGEKIFEGDVSGLNKCSNSLTQNYLY
ncbi:MAG: ATP-binding cassette domain-containing protein [Bacteroidales bacterium]|nr:ATP-binding cassette domain-containing protein [Bacteroidales bacterium]